LEPLPHLPRTQRTPRCRAHCARCKLPRTLRTARCCDHARARHTFAAHTAVAAHAAAAAHACTHAAHTAHASAHLPLPQRAQRLNGRIGCRWHHTCFYRARVARCRALHTHTRIRRFWHLHTAVLLFIRGFSSGCLARFLRFSSVGFVVWLLFVLVLQFS